MYLHAAQNQRETGKAAYAIYFSTFYFLKTSSHVVEGFIFIGIIKRVRKLRYAMHILASHTMIVVKLLYCLIIVHAYSATFCRKTNRPIERSIPDDDWTAALHAVSYFYKLSKLGTEERFYFLNVRTLFLIFCKIFVFVHVLAYLRIFAFVVNAWISAVYKVIGTFTVCRVNMRAIGNFQMPN
ncbi:hypothetical protein K0M31_000341 [Melipona bicolor]|uniref:Uncharacterized protein n=1 Tax=Melipona bicolor TaxID=60889 RepID=A0AA40KWZ1_9HYME|nr:hypothetical protein K0M31_000341 [Melipona bicolor]